MLAFAVNAAVVCLTLAFTTSLLLVFLATGWYIVWMSVLRHVGVVKALLASSEARR